MKARVTTLRNPCNPGQRQERTVRRGRRIRALAPRTPLPVVAYFNGRPILRAEWRRRVADGDRVAFVVLPMGGGGGKNPLQIVFSVAMMVWSGPMATAMLGEQLAGQIVFGELTLGRLVGGAISMVGNAIIGSAFAGSPSSPSPQVMSSAAAASPTYNLSAQGNMARIDAAIPVQYGRLDCFPDFAAQPYAEYSGNEQYLFELLCLGQGEYEIEAVRIEDTSIASFDEIDMEVIGPGESLTLFPAAVTTSGEVSGQALENGTWVGGFIANAAGTTANSIAVDVVCPRGLYYANDSGGLSAVTVRFSVEARAVDDDGVAIGSWTALGSEVISAATNTPQRHSYRYGVTAGRYEVRVQRTSAPGGTARYGDDLIWAGLRAYLPETRTWPGKTLIALRMRASNNLSGQAARKINVIATRKLPVYAAGAWSAPQVTRSPAWALADALRSTDYGGGLPDARIDLDQFVTWAADCAARGDTFDGRFDSTMTLWEACQKIGQAVRTRPYLQGGVVHVARDQAVTVPVCMYSMRNIVRGSLSVDYLMPTEDTADALDVGYFDADVWSPRRVSAALPGSASVKPYKVELFGVTSRDQAYREGLYLAAVNRYRRKKISFQTEMEGFIPAFGDLITISHDMPAWGTSGEITGYDEPSKVLTLSEPVTFGAGTHYLGLRLRDGSVAGPYAVTAGIDAYHVEHTGTLDLVPYTGGAAERTHFAFGAGETWRQPARVVAVRPAGLYRVAIEAINEDDSVHTADTGATAPAAQYSQLPTRYTSPVVAGLTARSALNDLTTAMVSWQSAPGARYYVVDVSSDGDTWSRVGETTSNNMAIKAVYGNATLIRVAPFGLTMGPSIQIAYETVSDYMWAALDTGLMWAADDTTLMWS